MREHAARISMHHFAKHSNIALIFVSVIVFNWYINGDSLKASSSESQRSAGRAGAKPSTRSVTIDARHYLAGNGLVEDPAKLRAFADACAAASMKGARVRVHAAGIFKVRFDPALGSAYGERYAMLIRGCNHAVLDFADATWVFDGKDDEAHFANVIGIRDSIGLKAKLGTVNWAKPPFAQGTIMSKTSSTFDLALDAGFFPTFNEAQRIEAYARDGTNLNRILTKDTSAGADAKGWTVSYPAHGIMRVDCGPEAHCAEFLKQMKSGDLYVITYRIYGADAVRLDRVSDAEIDLHVVTAAGMALRLTDGTDDRLNVMVKARNPNLVSTTADGVHVRASRGSLSVTGEIWNTGDDPLNVEVPSYPITKLTSPRSVSVFPSYPVVLPRSGDTLVGIDNNGTVTTLGKVIAVSGNDVTVAHDFPQELDKTWRVSDASAYPATSVDLTVGYARGHVRVSVPNVRMRVRGTNLWGSVSAEYIPSFYGEGIPPNNVFINATLTGSAKYASMPGAVVVQAYKADGSGYAPAGAIVNSSIRATVVDTGGSAIFLAGTKDATIDLTVNRCCIAPNKTKFALSDRAIALVNATGTRINLARSPRSSTARIGLGGTSSVDAPASHVPGS